MYLLKILVILAIVTTGILANSTSRFIANQNDRFLDLVISARTQKIQIFWKNLNVNGKLVLRSDSGNLLNQVVQTKDGWIDTNIVYNYAYFRSHITSYTSCYGYYVDFYRDLSSTTPYLSTCMMAYPRWMENMRPFIGNKRFRDIFIPGSHDAAAYDLVKGETFLNKIFITQDEDIRGQLLAGIRYFDIRPAYYPVGSIKFWVNHGMSRVQPMEQVLRDVYNFVKETNEIVIVDFHEFPVGFNSLDVHKKLVQFVNETIGDQIVTLKQQWGATLNQIWNSGNSRIILGYNENRIVSQFYPFTWPAVNHRWANTDNIDNLKNYLYNVNSEPIYSMTPVADMAQLTPTTWGFIIGRYKSLRQMADNSNPLVSDWYRNDLGFKANIVALEFIRGTTVIKDGVKWNFQRGLG